jgi:hypothetical protein
MVSVLLSAVLGITAVALDASGDWRHLAAWRPVVLLVLVAFVAVSCALGALSARRPVRRQATSGSEASERDRRLVVVPAHRLVAGRRVYCAPNHVPSLERARPPRSAAAVGPTSSAH